jgi:ribosomal protein S14
MSTKYHIQSDLKIRYAAFRKERQSSLLRCIYNEHLIYSQDNLIDSLHEPHFHYAHYISFKRLYNAMYITKVRNRCIVNGSARAINSKYRLSRFAFKALAIAGNLNGITKSSW